MEKFPIVEEFKRTVRGIFYGMAIPCDKRTADGGTIKSETFEQEVFTKE